MNIENLVQKGFAFIKNPKKHFESLEFYKKKSQFCHKIASYSWLDDKFFIEYKFYKMFGYRLNLKCPQTLNEKILWSKLYDRNPLFTPLADKYAVRDYIEQKIGSEHLTNLLGVYEDPKEINWDSLPAQCVIKATHGCKMNIICTDKGSLDVEETINQLQNWMGQNHYWKSREWHYKNIPPRIIIEEYLNDGKGISPRDFKVYCFNGRAEYIMVGEGRQEGNLKFYYFDRDWNLCPLSKSSQQTPPDFKIPKPDGIEELLACAEILAEPFAFVRADFYLINGETIFSELTFTPSAGFDTRRLPETDMLFGKLYPLSSKRIKC